MAILFQERLQFMTYIKLMLKILKSMKEGLKNETCQLSLIKGEKNPNYSEVKALLFHHMEFAWVDFIARSLKRINKIITFLYLSWENSFIRTSKQISVSNQWQVLNLIPRPPKNCWLLSFHSNLKQQHLQVLIFYDIRLSYSVQAL